MRPPGQSRPQASGLEEITPIRHKPRRLQIECIDENQHHIPWRGETLKVLLENLLRVKPALDRECSFDPHPHGNAPSEGDADLNTKGLKPSFAPSLC
jgi:hypothetical protein